MNEILTLEQVLEIFKKAGLTKNKEVIRRWVRQRKLKAIIPDAKRQGLSFYQKEIEQFVVDYAKKLELKREQVVSVVEESVNVDIEKQELLEEIKRLKTEIAELQSKKEFTSREGTNNQEIKENIGEEISMILEGNKKEVIELFNAINGSNKFYGEIKSNKYIGNDQTWMEVGVSAETKTEISFDNNVELSAIEVNSAVDYRSSIEVNFKSKRGKAKYIEFIYTFRLEPLTGQYISDAIDFYLDKRKYYISSKTEKEIESLLGSKRVQTTIKEMIIKELKKKRKYSHFVKKIEQ